MQLVRLFGCLLVLVSSAVAQHLLDSCGTLDRPHSTYILQRDVSSPGTCFLVTAEGITLDLNQHTITYGTAGGWKPGEETEKHFHGVLGQACWDTGGHADAAACGDAFGLITIKNGTIVQADGNPPFSHAIRWGQGNRHAVALEDLKIRISSPSTVAVLVVGGSGGNRIRDLQVENRSEFVFNRHQLEGATVKFTDMPKTAQPNVVEGLQVEGGPQSGLVETAAGSHVSGAKIGLMGAFTNDFAIFLFGDRSQAHHNRVEGRSRGIQVDARSVLVENNLVRTYEEPVNAEYGGCQMQGTFGIQLESHSREAHVRNNDVRVSARECDARAFRVTDVKRGNANRSEKNVYEARLEPGAKGKAVAASFSNAKEALLENDTLIADTHNAEIVWDGGQNIVFRGVTFIKGDHAAKDYATFALLPGSNNAKFQPTSAELTVIDPIFKNGASADSFLMRPIGFGEWATPAEYSIQWTYSLQVTGPNGAPLMGVHVTITDSRNAPALNAVTDAAGRVPPVVLTQFRRFNTAQSIQKEPFTYKVSLALGGRTRVFDVHVTEPATRVEVLP